MMYSYDRLCCILERIIQCRKTLYNLYVHAFKNGTTTTNKKITVKKVTITISGWRQVTYYSFFCVWCCVRVLLLRIPNNVQAYSFVWCACMLRHIPDEQTFHTRQRRTLWKAHDDEQRHGSCIFSNNVTFCFCVCVCFLKLMGLPSDCKIGKSSIVSFPYILYGMLISLLWRRADASEGAWR